MATSDDRLDTFGDQMGQYVYVITVGDTRYILTVVDALYTFTVGTYAHV